MFTKAFILGIIGIISAIALATGAYAILSESDPLMGGLFLFLGSALPAFSWRSLA